MKKSTIWFISIVMGVSFAALIYLQVNYFEQVIRIRKQQFDSSVSHSLAQVAQKTEMEVTLKGLKDDLRKDSTSSNVREERPISRQSMNLSTDTFSTKLEPMKKNTAALPKGLILKYQSGNSMSDISKKMKDEVKSRYFYQRAMLDKVIYSILYNSSEKPLKDYINFRLLDMNLKAELSNNGIDIPYHISVTTRSGEEIYRCPDYSPKGEENAYRQVLMPNNPPSNTGILKIHFPDMQHHIFQSARFMITSIIFTLILLVTFIITIYIIFRQKKLSEIKNDFINNMTHELKTPVASISLAVQMLLDPGVKKTEQMTSHLSGIINDETKRLKMLIEKVLQTSVLEGQKVQYRNRELNLNQLVGEVVNTFSIKVEQLGGKLETDIQAEDDTIYGDQMHVTNVLSNLMDNAVKYRREDTEFHLKVATWNNAKNQVCVSIEDNGIGIKKENLKKIFEKFYRVHTGNRHDVKGFGLGLAYVKGIVDSLHGKITAESELGKGTKFIISIPIINN